jgi:iron complex transport system ATP-binding protein
MGSLTEDVRWDWKAHALQCGYGRKRPVGPCVSATWSTHGLHALIGANGSGKSTLLRTLAGWQPPLTGQVELGGRPLAQAGARERSGWFAWVPSTPPRTSGLTVGQTLALIPGTEAEQRSMLATVGEVGWWSQRLSQLSDGQAQRVMLGRALLQNTPWLVLDEPTAFLDARARSAFHQLLAACCQAPRHLRVMLATHDLHALEAHPELRSVRCVTHWALRDLDAKAGVPKWEAAQEDET